MLQWFYEHFEDPAEETPYNSQEGGYLFIWGGPYDAREQLNDEFGSLVSDEIIDEIVDEVESDGIVDWAPGPKHADHARAREEWEADHANDEGDDLPNLDPVINLLESGRPPNYGNENELARRRQVLSDMEALQKALTSLKPAHGAIGHNNPPADDAPQVKTITEAGEAAETIKQEIIKEKPDALKIAKSTSTLKIVLGWLGSRATAAVDKMVGAALIDAGLGSPLLGKLWSAVRSASEWLLSVAPWPF